MHCAAFPFRRNYLSLQRERSQDNGKKRIVSDIVKKCTFQIMDSKTVIKYCVHVFNSIEYFTFLEVDSEVGYSYRIQENTITIIQK